MMISVYLLYHLALGDYGRAFDGFHQGYWWQYMIAIFIGISGFILLYFGNAQMVNIDKTTGIISKGHKTIFCQKKQTDWAISQVKNVRVFRRGHDGIQFKNIHYEIQFDFAEVPNKVMMKTMSLEKAVKQMLVLKTFFCIPIKHSDVKYIDETTSQF